jgi:hypothetical protein
MTSADIWPNGYKTCADCGTRIPWSGTKTDRQNLGAHMTRCSARAARITLDREREVRIATECAQEAAEIDLGTAIDAAGFSLEQRMVLHAIRVRLEELELTK